MSHQGPDICWCHGVDEEEQQSEVRIRRKVYISTMHLNALHIVEQVVGWRYFWEYLLHQSVFC